MLLVHVLLEVYVAGDLVESLLNDGELLVQRVERVLARETVRVHVAHSEGKVQLLRLAIELPPAQVDCALAVRPNRGLVLPLVRDAVERLP